jgi:hypothetical protein
MATPLGEVTGFEPTVSMLQCGWFSRNSMDLGPSEMFADFHGTTPDSIHSTVTEMGILGKRQRLFRASPAC